MFLPSSVTELASDRTTVGPIRRLPTASARRFSVVHEREVRFLGETARVLKSLETRPVEISKITQFYIRRSKLVAAFRYACENFGASLSDTHQFSFATGRIRKTEVSRIRTGQRPCTISTYELTFKTQKRKGIPRVEMNLVLSSFEFQSLLEFGGNSAIEKTRLATSAIAKLGRSRTRIQIDVDVVTRCGASLVQSGDTSRQESLPRYCFVEVEVGRDEDLQYILDNGLQEIPFSETCLIDRLPKSVRRHFSMTKLAKVGWGKDAEKLAQRLLKGK